MKHDPKYDVAHELISDILSQRDILLSVNSGSGIAEVACSIIDIASVLFSL
jgi:hypothetical protein